MNVESIRPDALLRQYVQLSNRDGKKFRIIKSYKEIKCIACQKKSNSFAFQKKGYTYKQCQSCRSLYLSPRPSARDFSRFYKNSESEKFWSEKFFPAVEEIRRKQIFLPRVKTIIKKVNKKVNKITKVIDVGSGFGLFLEEWGKVLPDCERMAIEPSQSMASICRKKGLHVFNDSVENISPAHFESADIVTCFEVLEHVHNPKKFLKYLVKLVRPGGHIFLSTLCIDGFDLQILWQRSTQIMPPHHINFFSKIGLQKIFLLNGIQADIETPGKLDVEIVCKYYQNHFKKISFQPFINLLAENQELRKKFQKFLALNKLSSHVLVSGTKNISI